MVLDPNGPQLVVSKDEFERNHARWEQDMLIAKAYALQADNLLTDIANEDVEASWPNIMVAMQLGVHAEELFLKAGLHRFGTPMVGHQLDALYGGWAAHAARRGLAYEMRFAGSRDQPAFHFRYMTNRDGESYAVGDIEPLREYLATGDMHDAFEVIHQQLAALP